MKDISIIIVTHNRIKQLELLLGQIKDQFTSSEVIVVINNDDPESYKSLKGKFAVNWILGDFSTPGSARNLGIKNSTKDWILFLDDDVELPQDFSSKAESYYTQLKGEAVIFGGPDQNKADSSILNRALSLTLTSPMATAHTRLRHTLISQEIKPGDESNLILCNLWVKKSFLEKSSLLFNDHLFRNEENLFITEALSKNGNAWYVPELYVFHERKTGFFSLGRAVFSSGKHRVKSLIFSSKLFNPLFFVPAFFVLYLILIPFIRRIGYIYTPLEIYLTLSIFMSIKVSLGHRGMWPLVFFYQIFINVLYGLGTLWGLLSLPFWLIRIKR